MTDSAEPFDMALYVSSHQDLHSLHSNDHLIIIYNDSVSG